MNQRDAVIQVMQANGGYATLGYLYANAINVAGADWTKTKTPFASMRRIVQDPNYFFKIRPGLWALKGWEKKIPFDVMAQGKTSAKATEVFDHTYYQGLLVEIGNLRQFQTFVPNQDKNHKFLAQPLGSISTLPTIYPFTYPNLVERARTIDVTWFNDRKLPDTFFEVEHSTDIQNSLGKFFDLQDFNVHFWIVADKTRQREFQTKLARPMFKPIANRVEFKSYDYISDLHSKANAYFALLGKS